MANTNMQAWAVEVREATIVNRPSRVIRSPYVCDLDIEGTCTLGHSPSLGCDGMVNKEQSVYVTKKTTGKCEYTVKFGIEKTPKQVQVVGVDPSFAEIAAHEILTNGMIGGLELNELRKQVKYDDCRFDFAGTTELGQKFICEVKNVSVARYENVHPSIQSKNDYSDRDPNSKIAVFPSGYQAKGLTHSPRAVKQLRKLIEIKRDHPSIRCIVMYVVQRDDVCRLETSNGDDEYRVVVTEAKAVGVEFVGVVVRWTLNDGVMVPSIVRTDLPVVLT